MRRQNNIKPVIKELSRKIRDRFSVTAVLCRGADPRKVFDELVDLAISKCYGCMDGAHEGISEAADMLLKPIYQYPTRLKSFLIKFFNIPKK